MNTPYVSLDRIFAKLYRDLPLDNISEDDVIEWSGEALEFIGSVSLSEDAIAFLEVKNHQCQLPMGLHTILQVALNLCDNIGNDNFCPKNVIEELVPVENEENFVPVALNCNGEPVNAYDLAYYRPFFDIQREYFNWRGSRHYKKYQPIRLSSGTGLHNLVCDKGEDCYGPHEYSVVQGKYLRFTFREGIVALAYTRQMTDPETGYPMIPDEVSAITAITKYVTMKLMEREFYANREGSQGRLQKAEADWQWYCAQASTQHFAPHGIDDFQDLLEQRQHMIPNLGHYYNFFGNLNKGENRRWNDPDGRNRSFRILNG